MGPPLTRREALRREAMQRAPVVANITSLPDVALTPAVAARAAHPLSRREALQREAAAATANRVTFTRVVRGGIAAATVTAAAGALVIAGVVGSDDTAVASAEPVATETPAEPAVNPITATAAVTSEPALEPKVVGDLSEKEVPFTGGSVVSVDGTALDEVASVAVNGAVVPIVNVTDDSLEFEVPAVAETALGETASVEFLDANGNVVPIVDEPAAASAPTPVAPSADDILATATAVHETVLTLTYGRDVNIDAQVNYVLAHWNDYNEAYVAISGNDCVNFTSQSLLERGWTMDEDWYYDNGQMGAAWASSTAMRDYLRAHPERAIELDDSQRDQVKVGDIAQFDWDNSGDRDHTTVVTKVEHTDSGTRIWVGGHTKDSDYWDVDEAVANSGGTVSYFSVL